MIRFSQAELLRRYQAGERDFRGADLRGLRFRGATLAGADFSGADLRGTDFLEADLREAKFVGCRCGLPLVRLMGQGVMGMGFGLIAGFMQFIAFVVFGNLLFASQDSLLQHAGWLVSIGAGVMLLAGMISLAWEGFNFKGISYSAIAAFAIAGAVAGAVFAGAVDVARAGFGVGVVALSSSILLLSWWRARQGAPGYAGCRSFGIALGSVGATRFSGADLRGAFFTDAVLALVSFAATRRQTTRLERVCWHGAKGLELARPGATLLAEPRCRQLLLSGSAPGADLQGLNLRGAYLPQADLRGADLRETNLSEAVLTEAYLENANLKASQCLGTDLQGAHLSGATLEAWNIDHSTKLNAIDCAYVYLLEPFDALGQRRDDHHRERLPHDPDKSFGPGDFEIYFKQLLEEVKLLIKNGVDAKAFQQAFQEVTRQYPQITPELITGLKKSGNDVLVTLQAPASVDKGAVEQTFFAKYNAVMLENARLKGLLDGERRVSEVERERATQFAELASRLVPAVHSTRHPTTVVNNTFHAGDGNLINTGTFHTGGGLVNLGDLSDQAHLTIEALPDQRPAAGQPSLRELLQELKASVDADMQLPDDTRAEALTEVTELAKAARDPHRNAGPARRAINALKGLSAGISETNKAVAESSKLVGAIKRLLPLIAAFFVG